MKSVAFIDVFCAWLVSMGVLAASYWIYYRFISTKFGLPPGFPLFIGLLSTITVGLATTYVGIHFSGKALKESTQEIQEAMYPNDFRVNLHIPDGSGSLFQAPGDNIHIVKTNSRKIKLRIQVYNRSKYPANYVMTGLFIAEEDFEEDAGDLITALAKFVPLAGTLREHSGLEVTHEDGKKALKGYSFLVDQIEADQKYNIGWLYFTLTTKNTYFAVRVRNNSFVFRIELAESVPEITPQIEKESGGEDTGPDVKKSIEQKSGTTPVLTVDQMTNEATPSQVILERPKGQSIKERDVGKIQSER